MYQKARNVWEVFDGDIQGKRILDLGCGANQEWERLSELGYRWENERLSNETYRIDRTFEPWACRALLEMGAEPAGVDIGDLEDEAFEHHQVNLLKEGALKKFPDKSFDAVMMSLLVTSPSIANTMKSPRGDQIKNEWLRL